MAKRRAPKAARTATPQSPPQSPPQPSPATAAVEITAPGLVPPGVTGGATERARASAAAAETTGRFVVIFRAGATSAGTIRSTLSQAAGIKNVMSSSDYATGAMSAEDMSGSEAAHFEKLGVVIVSGMHAVQGLAATTSDANSPILAIEPEYIARLSAEGFPASGMQYLRGYRDAINHLYEQLAAGGAGGAPGGAEAADVANAFEDDAQFTWGLQATRVSTSGRSGQGIRVAVLDTGMDLAHPDFTGRAIVSEQFAGFPVQDVHGHGTHCVGTACGPQAPASGVRRYGCAYNAQIYVGKVFNHDVPRPGAPTGSILAGIEWAVGHGCRVVSLSLGSAINQKIQQYELPIQRALNAGTLVVAAAGNNANRPGLPGFDPQEPSTEGFVEPPANADAAMAVAAVDNRMRIAVFSGRSSQLTGVGGKVNIAGPGVAVFSSVPAARGRHALFNGTSMATPHVAGIAALWAQATGESGIALWNRMLQSARALPLSSLDVGSGLVQAPP